MDVWWPYIDLLSKNCIFDLINNSQTQKKYMNSVVICFQKFVSLIFWTTKKHFMLIAIPLWFAFKNLYLWYSEQHPYHLQSNMLCCDLLSKICIFDILNNGITTSSSPMPLWFAFKNLYLWYSEQQTFRNYAQIDSCDLLSKICIFDILNNRLACINKRWSVVICFQKFVSLIFWTTVAG